jgi:hypothetical protein
MVGVAAAAVEIRPVRGQICAEDSAGGKPQIVRRDVTGGGRFLCIAAIAANETSYT